MMIDNRANNLMWCKFYYKNRNYKLLKLSVNLHIGNKIYFNLNNQFYSTNTGAQILSLQDLVKYRTGENHKNPYHGLLKDKENSYLNLGNAKRYPAQSDYNKYKDICDWKSRIRQIIKEELLPGQTYDIAVLGHDILNEEYITYGKHFLINNESDINAVITRIEGNIFVNSLSFNSGEIGVGESNNDLKVFLWCFLINESLFKRYSKSLSVKSTLFDRPFTLMISLPSIVFK